jgi:hypothetical protein
VPYLLHPNSSTLSSSQTVKPAELPALPAPKPANRLTFDAFWQRLDDAAHIGLFGMSQWARVRLAGHS